MCACTCTTYMHMHHNMHMHMSCTCTCGGETSRPSAAARSRTVRRSPATREGGGSGAARAGQGWGRGCSGRLAAPRRHSRTCKRKEAGGARWEVEEAGRRRRGGRVSCGGVGCEAGRAPAGVDIARKRIFKTSRQPLFSFDSKPRAHACRTAPRAAPPEPSRPRCGSSAPTATKKRKEIHGIAAAAVTAAASSSTPAAFQPTPRSSLAAAGSTGPLRGLGSRVHPCPR